jgi:hypothetical protein
MPPTDSDLLTPEEVDGRLNWPPGKAARLARQRRLPAWVLPDGALRFRWGEVEALLVRLPACAPAPAG